MVKHVRIYVDFHKIWGIQFHGIYIPISDASVKISIGFLLLSKVSICHNDTQICSTFFKYLYFKVFYPKCPMICILLTHTYMRSSIIGTSIAAILSIPGFIKYCSYNGIPRLLGLWLPGNFFWTQTFPIIEDPLQVPTFLYERILCSCSNIEICPSSIRSQYQVGTPLLIQQQRLIRIPQWYYHTTLYIFYIPHS